MWCARATRQKSCFCEGSATRKTQVLTLTTYRATFGGVRGNIRPAVAGDHATFVRLFPELGVDDPPWDQARFIEEMMPFTLIAGDGGYAYYVIFGQNLHVRQIVVAPEARRRGVGRALMNEMADIARRAGCTTWRLNVMVGNEAATKLYESVGMTRGFASFALRLNWSRVPPSESGHARLIDRDDDERVEREMRFVPGRLATARATGRNVLVMLEDEDAIVAAAVFDPRFPGASPFRAARPELAVALLGALRPHARPEDTFLNVTIEDQPNIAEALIALGARVRHEMVHMAGAL